MTDPVKKRKYIAGRYDDKSSKAVDEPSTEEGGAALNENPAKTKKRIAAQAAGDISYRWGGKEEYAGRYEDSEEKEPEPPKPPVKKDTAPPTKAYSHPPAERTSIKQSSGERPNRMPPTVKWLKGVDRGKGKQKRIGREMGN